MTKSCTSASHNASTPSLPRQSICEIQLETQPRGVWTNITSFHKNWRQLSGTQLHDDLLILSNIDLQWILHPERHRKEHQVTALREYRFCSLLQWKHSMGHIHCFRNNDSFWSELNYQLTECLPDPTSYHTVNYDPLILDEAHYRMTDCHCHGAIKRLIFVLLRGETLDAAATLMAIKEIILQSISTLKFINDSGIRIDRVLNVSTRSTRRRQKRSDLDSTHLSDDEFIESLLDDGLCDLDLESK